MDTKKTEDMKFAKKKKKMSGKSAVSIPPTSFGIFL